MCKEMESINLRIENWESNEIEEISYSASLKIPPKDELLRLLSTHLCSLHYNWQCRTGLLCKNEHSLKLCLYREYHEPKIGVYVNIKNSVESGHVIQVRGIDVTYVSSTADNENVTVEDNMTKVDPPKPMEVADYEFWQSTCGWPEHASILFLVLNVVKRKPPVIVNDDDFGSCNSGLGYIGLIDIKKYFLSDQCSDLVIKCGSCHYPAHKIILSSRSEYFAAMLSSSMKEAKECFVKIDDMTPASVEELLRFIYHGEIHEPIVHAKELFIAADKYGMGDLKEYCERHLVENLVPENAMEMYDLTQMHGHGGSSILNRKAKEVLLWNKDKFAPDPETLKEFTCKYPELVFELLHFES